MKKRTVLLCFFIVILLFTSCRASGETLLVNKKVEQGGDSILLAAKYHPGNSWYCLNSDESVVSAEVLTSEITDDVELGGVRQDCAMLVVNPVKTGSSEITMLYSQSIDGYSADATLYSFKIEVDETLEVHCTSEIPNPSIALGLAAKDGSYWELSSFGDRIDIMDASYIESDDPDASNVATCYFPIIPLSEGISRAYFVLKDADGSIIQRVTYAITVNSDMSISLRIP